MKKLLVALAAVVSLVAVPVTTFAAPPVSPGVQRVPAWNMNGDYVINFTCAGCVPHFIHIASYNVLTGAFYGSGYSTVNAAVTFTVSGTVSGNSVSMLITYTGFNPGYYVNVNGTIAPDGSMSGTATDSAFQTFPWSTTSGFVTVFANHGAVVNSLPIPQVAQSSYGKPVNSLK